MVIDQFPLIAFDFPGSPKNSIFGESRGTRRFYVAGRHPVRPRCRRRLLSEVRRSRRCLLLGSCVLYLRRDRCSGAVFAQKNVKENDATVTITANIQRGESHGEGVTFYIAKGWFVNKVLTDFPGNGSFDDSFKMTSIVKTADSGSAWSYMVQIGCDRNMDIPDGASGTVVIQMVWDYKAVGPTEYIGLYGVGAGSSDVTTGNGKTSINIDIPLE